MASQDERRSFDNVIGELADRVDKLERATRSPTIYLPNSPSAPAAVPGGGLFFVSGGALHWRGAGGTDTTVAPS